MWEKFAKLVKNKHEEGIKAERKFYEEVSLNTMEVLDRLSKNLT